MTFDIKNNLMKTTVSDNHPGKKNVKTTIDESLIAETSQKYLELGLNHSKKENLKNKAAKAQIKEIKRPSSNKEKEEDAGKKIVRDPLILLKIF